MPHLKPMLEALYSSTRVPFKLIIVESESTDGTKEFLEKFLINAKNVSVYHTKKEGLTKAINFGINKAGKKDVYLTQDDVIHFRLYGRDWLLEMNDASKGSKVGLVTGLYGGGISGPEYMDGLHWAGTWNTYIPRKAINKLKYYEEI